jgi:uncharacterized alpha-E superfamily protein
VIARVADHCFWLGRYLERVDSTARVLHVTSNLALDAELSPRQCWQPVIVVAGEREQFAGAHGEEAARDGELVQRYMTWDETNHASLVRSIVAARDNARAIREVVSLEVWETINELYLWVKSPAAAEEYAESRWSFYRGIRQRAELCRGLFQSTMLHDDPLDFIWLGAMIERTGQTARIVDVHHHAVTLLAPGSEVVETSLWLSLLRSCSGFEPFMKRHQGRVTGRAVAAFLLLEPSFPRSVRYSVGEARGRLEAIRPPSQHDLPGGRSLLRIGALDAWLGELTPETLHPLHDLATRVVNDTGDVCVEIGREMLGYQVS